MAIFQELNPENATAAANLAALRWREGWDGFCVRNCGKLHIFFCLEIKKAVAEDLKDGFLQDGRISRMSIYFFFAKMLLEMSHETYHAYLVRIRIVPNFFGACVKPLL